MKTLLAILFPLVLVAATAPAQTTQIWPSGSWDPYSGPPVINQYHACPSELPCGVALTLPAPHTPQVGTSGYWRVWDYNYGPNGHALSCADQGSLFVTLTLGASQNPTWISSSVTNTLDALQIPVNDTTVLMQFNYASDWTYPWSVPNDPALAGTNVWAQGAHWWTENSTPYVLVAVACKCTILAP